MRKINVIATCLVSLCSVELQTSPITVNVIQASHMDTLQWESVSNLWCSSFYNAYKDLPYDQVDNAIKDASSQALIDYLQRRIVNYRLRAIANSYSFVLVYKNEQLAGYTLYHMLDHQATIHIDIFAVDPSFQGQGIGKTLLDATIKANPEAVAVVLTTRILNKRAQGFYRQQGFYEINSIDGVVFDARYSILLKKDIEL